MWGSGVGSGVGEWCGELWEVVLGSIVGKCCIVVQCTQVCKIAQRGWGKMTHSLRKNFCPCGTGHQQAYVEVLKSNILKIFIIICDHKGYIISWTLTYISTGGSSPKNISTQILNLQKTLSIYFLHKSGKFFKDCSWVVLHMALL